MPGPSTHHYEVLLPSGPATVYGSAVAAGGGTLVASGTRTVYGSINKSGGGTLVAVGTRKVFGSALLAGAGGFGDAHVSGVLLHVHGTRKVLGSALLSSTDVLTATGLRKVLGSATFAITGGGGTGEITLDEPNVASDAGGGSGGANFDFDFDTENDVAPGGRCFVLVTCDTGGDGSGQITSLTGGGVTWNLVEDNHDGFGSEYAALYVGDCPSGLAASTTLSVDSALGTTWGWTVAASSYLSSTAWEDVGSPDVNFENFGGDEDWSSDATAITGPSLIITGVSARGSATTAGPDAGSTEDNASTGPLLASIVRRIEDAAGSYTNSGTLDDSHIGLSLITMAYGATGGGGGLLVAYGEVSTPGGPATVYGTAALSSAETLTALGVRKVLGVGILGSGGTLSAAGKVTVYGTAALLGIDSLQATGTRVVSGSAALTGSDALTVLGVRKVLGRGDLVLVDVLTAQGIRFVTVMGTAQLLGGGTLTASGRTTQNILGTASISLSGILTALGESFPTPVFQPGRRLGGSQFSPAQPTPSLHLYPISMYGGGRVWVYKQYVIQVPYERRAVDRQGNEYRQRSDGTFEPV